MRRNRRLCCDGQIRKQKHNFCCSVSCEKFPNKPQQKPLINHCTSDEDWRIDGGDCMELTGLSGTINYRKCSSIQTATFSLQFSNLRHCFQNYSVRLTFTNPEKHTELQTERCLFTRHSEERESRVWLSTGGLSSARFSTSTVALFEGNAPQNLDQRVTVPCPGTRSSGGFSIYVHA